MKRGDFYGEETLVLENEHLLVEVLATAGPRIVRLQLAGSGENLFGEVADAGWDTPWGFYRLRGGHRLWFAPENPPLTSAPDEGGLLVSEGAHGLRLERLEPEPGMSKVMEIELASDRAAVTVKHIIRNEGKAVVEHAPWAITILPLGETLPALAWESGAVVTACGSHDRAFMRFHAGLVEPHLAGAS